MARLVTRSSGDYGFGGDVPNPLGAEDFDAEQEAIKRRRLLMESLLSQDQTKGMTGWKGGLANLALGITKGIHNYSLDASEKELASRRSAAARDWISRMPRPTPGVDEVNPSMPQPGEIGPPLPTNYAEEMQKLPQPTGGASEAPQPMLDGNDVPPVPQPLGGLVPQRPSFAHTPELPMIPTSLRDAAAWAQEGGGFSPYHAALAAKVTEQAMTMPEKIAEAKRIRDERREDKAEAARIEAQKIAYKRIEKEQDDAKRAAEREAERTKDAADKYERDRANAADREALRQGLGGGGATPKLQLTGTVDTDMTPLAFDPVNNRLVRVGTNEPPKGTPESRGGAEKGAKIVRNVAGALERGQAALDMLEQTPDAFGGWKAAKAAAASILPDAAESAIRENYIYSPEEMETQAYIGREGAQILHDLYGAALTRNESARAKPFEYKAGDTPNMIASKIRSMMKILSGKTGEQSPAAQSAGKPAGAATTNADLLKKYGLGR